MAGRDGKHMTKVGIEQGAERIFIDDDGYFNVDGVDVTGNQLRNALYAPMQILRPTMANTQSLTEKNLTSGIGVVIFSTTSNWTNISFWVTSCVAGMEVFLLMRPGSATGQSGKIWISGSGCSIMSPHGADISGFFMRNSSNSQAMVRLRCFEDDEWCVIETREGYAES